MLRFRQTPPDLETINFNETEVFRSLVVGNYSDKVAHLSILR